MHDLSDKDDIMISIKKDLHVQEGTTACMLSIFSSCDPHTKINSVYRVFAFLCMVLLFGARASTFDLCSLEVSLNNILKKIWSLPWLNIVTLGFCSD